MIVRDENTGAGRLSVGLALAFLTCAALPEAGAAGTPTVVVQPLQAAPGATVTLSGTGFGRFISTANNRVTFNGVPALVQRWERGVIEVKVPFQAATGLVVSWTDAEIVVRVPRRNLYSIGKRGEFYDNLATGPLVLRRGSWDVQPDGTCCTAKQWLTVEAGPFTIESKGLPDTTYWNNRPDASTSQ